MAWTGDTLALLEAYMNERDMRDVVPAVVDRNPLLARVESKYDAADYFLGKYAVIRMKTAVPYNVAPRVEAGDVPLPGQHAFEAMRVRLREYTGSTGITQNEMEEAAGQPLAAGVLAEEKLADCIADMRRTLNMELGGDGTGRLARVASWNGTTKTVTVDNTIADFGWSGCARIRDGMKVDIYTVADITGSSAWTVKCSGVTVSNVNRALGTFVVSGSTNAPADGDFVFLSNSVTLTPDGKFSSFNGCQGLMNIVDDGATTGWGSGGDTNNGSWYGATFQGVDRRLYPQLQAKILKANDWGTGTAGTPASWDLAVINDAIRWVDEEGDGDGDVSALYMNGRMRDCLMRKAANEQNPFVTTDDGKIVPGMYIEQFRTSNGKLLPIIPITGLPNNTIYAVTERDFKLYWPVKPSWYKRNGQIWAESPGARNMTYEAWLRTVIQLGARRCDNCVRIEDLLDTE